MDKQKIRQAIQAAQKRTDELEQALDRNDQRAAGAALYNLRRELAELAELAEDRPAAADRKKAG